MTALEAAYADRRVDLAQWGDDPQALAPVSFGWLDAEGGRAVAGPRALAQRALAELLTRRGSDPAEPDRGTDLLEELEFGVSSYGMARDAAGVAILLASRRLAAAEADSWPDDERLGKLELDNVVARQDGLEMSFSLTTRSGTAAYLPPVRLVMAA